MISAELGPQLESLVSKSVETGRYNSKSEVVREGIRLIQDRELRMAALDASISRGLADADLGRTKSATEVFDRLEARAARGDAARALALLDKLDQTG